MIKLRRRILPEIVITPPDKVSPELINTLNQAFGEIWEDLKQGNSEIKYILSPGIKDVFQGELILTKVDGSLSICTSYEGSLYYVKLNKIQ